MGCCDTIWYAGVWNAGQPGEGVVTVATVNGSIQDLWFSKGKVKTSRHGAGLRWRARLLVDGREVSRSFRRQEDAKRWLSTQQAALSSDEWINPAKGTVRFGEVADVWLARPDIRESTRERDHSYLRAMILPRLGTKSVRSITPDALDRLVADLGREGKAPATIRKASQIVGAVLEDAVRRGLIARSPHRGVRLPKATDDEMMFLTVEQIHRVAVALGEYRGMALLGGFGGLRLGEVIALTGDDVDLDAKTVTVRKTASELSTGVEVGPPKTRRAVRTVALPSFVIDARWQVDRLKLAGYLFPDSQGGPLRAHNWRRRVWKPAVETAGFPTLRFHDLRHSHVSMLIAMGENPKAIAARLGHKSVRTVLDVYGHLLSDSDQDIADRIEERYGTGMAQADSDT